MNLQPQSQCRAHPLISVQGVSVVFASGQSGSALRDLSFDLMAGEILGIVGESGSGKSVMCRAIAGLLPPSAKIKGQMNFEGRPYPLSDRRLLAGLRGHGIAMIFQDPMSALDPLMTVRRHLALRTPGDPGPLLTTAGFGDPGKILDSYPHQMSGGQCQRVAIACALAREPRLLIADEPTSALDVTVQASILKHLKAVAAERGMSIIFVTHDLAVAYQLCNQIIVMRNGVILETGSAAAVLAAPRADYTKHLIASMPRSRPHASGIMPQTSPPAGLRPIGVPSARHPALRLDNISVGYKTPDGRRFDAVRNVSVDVGEGEIVGLVGESASGKSTLAKAAVGLVTPSAGRISMNGRVVDWSRPEPSWRREIQYIFQDPRGALDPLGRIVHQVRQPLDIHRLGDKGEREAVARARLLETHLDDKLFGRKPGSLSGGQRQRATIARALTVRPRVLICDESVSALDVSIQAKILDLLLGLRDKYALAILFISHDLSVIQHICDRVVVMRHGKLIEEGPTFELFRNPTESYTRDLIAALPRLPDAPPSHLSEQEAAV
ncbi:ATP-binding cassette domain-containing protein [Mesorhizobium escarrei]|uniref:Glutathione ABC transporter ATP-binding protein n=1 Tax=Mesorhizobium escarrei TaxID=666018 RepID=A0ABN8JZG0_9HYPH|nr:ABC transporter ATP-binding protein [Mesorhizobium escarrei]CAH2402351.1 Glutathione ABC transporter ATP-binding protein [Mesorhizobium escarrei]